MNATPEDSSTTIIRPPQLIQAFVSGFNTVTNNMYLILLPIALDLLLWFGPHLRVKALMEPSMNDFLSFMRTNGGADVSALVSNLESLWKLFLNQYNLLIMMSTFPVGVPSLIAGQLPLQTPLGAPQLIEVHSIGQLLLGWLVLSLVGLGLGSVYFSAIARAVGKHLKLHSEAEFGCVPVSGPGDSTRVPELSPHTLAWEMMQTLLLVIALVIILILLMIPALFLSTFVALFSPTLAQFVLLMISFGALWFMVPLIFSPHGIFMCGQGVINAMLNSTRLVRNLLPGTGLFLLGALIIYQGLGTLWRIPPENSWMLLVGVLGSAFISTGLLAASFVYYRMGLHYLHSLRAQAPRSA